MISTGSKVARRTRQTLFVVRCDSSSASKRVLDGEGKKLQSLRSLRKRFGVLSSETEGYSEVIDEVCDLFTSVFSGLRDEIEEEGR